MMSDSNVIPPSPSEADYQRDSEGNPLIADASDPFALCAAWMAQARWRSSSTSPCRT